MKNRKLRNSLIVEAYKNTNKTISALADEYDVCLGTVKIALNEAGIEIKRRMGKIRHLNPQEKLHRWFKRTMLSEESQSQISNPEMALYLANILSKERNKPSPESYEDIFMSLYLSHDYKRLYENWIKSSKNRWLTPSIDHVTPYSRGGRATKNNLAIMTLFENKMKNDMTLEEWNMFKEKTNTKSTIFV